LSNTVSFLHCSLLLSCPRPPACFRALMYSLQALPAENFFFFFHFSVAAVPPTTLKSSAPTPVSQSKNMFQAFLDPPPPPWVTAPDAGSPVYHFILQFFLESVGLIGLDAFASVSKYISLSSLCSLHFDCQRIWLRPV